MSFFIVPIEVVPYKGGPETQRQPKYIPALGVDYSVMELGDNAVVLANTSPAQDTAVAANADAILVPPLDNSVAVVATQNALEALNIPAQWITAAMTYREVLRALVGIAQLIQRTQGVGVKITLAGNLDLTMVQIPANVRQALSDASDSLGLDRSGIVGGTTVRQALRILGKQWIDGRGVNWGGL